MVGGASVACRLHVLAYGKELPEHKWKREMFSQWNCEVDSGDIKPVNENDDWNDILAVVPVDGDSYSSEDTS